MTTTGWLDVDEPPVHIDKNMYSGSCFRENWKEGSNPFTDIGHTHGHIGNMILKKKGFREWSLIMGRGRGAREREGGKWSFTPTKNDQSLNPFTDLDHNHGQIGTPALMHSR